MEYFSRISIPQEQYNFFLGFSCKYFVIFMENIYIYIARVFASKRIRNFTRVYMQIFCNLKSKHGTAKERWGKNWSCKGIYVRMNKNFTGVY